MVTRSSGRPHTFVLDSNVLIHDPTALFRFAEHGIYLTMAVLEALDAAKNGASEAARNAREATRALDELLTANAGQDIAAGLALPSAGRPGGRLHFQTADLQPTSAERRMAGGNPLLGTVLALRSHLADRDVIVVSKDINLRIKAQILGITAEDYFNDRSIDDADLLPTGIEILPDRALGTTLELLCTRTADGLATQQLRGPMVEDWYPHLCIQGVGDELSDSLVSNVDALCATLRPAEDFGSTGKRVWGVHARNSEQNFALNLLMDPTVDLVTLLGTAGTGKTLLALAAGLAQTLDSKRFREIVVTRATVAVGEDIGFLPGTEEEKMAPWMGGLMDNLEVLTDSDNAASGWGRAATNDLLHTRIKIRSPAFMRGRTFLDRFLIIDEAQNLTAKQLKTLLTRAGPGTKVVCIGNLNQIDTPYLTETTSGLTAVVNRFRGWSGGGHITLQRGERSQLAHAASELL